VDAITTALLQTGAVGAVLAWFMLRQEKQNGDIVKSMQAVERAIDRQTRALMLERISRPDTPDSVKRLAQDLANEIPSSKLNPPAFEGSR
jgi:hypothetical protein